MVPIQTYSASAETTIGPGARVLSSLRAESGATVRSDRMTSSVTESPASNRDAEIRTWLTEVVGSHFRVEPASSDASFRRYLRVSVDSSTRILMDAPPEHEDCRPFVHAQALLRAAGVNVPEILEADLDRGLLLLSDLGRQSYLDALDQENCEALYGDALSTLERMQTRIAADAVPDFDQGRLDSELRLFPDWFLERHLGIEVSEDFRRTMETCFEKLVGVCLEQPQVFVHRDYHSRNLMRVDAGNPGVLDFQDAVRGPVAYDLVSLFRDVYITWPPAQVAHWVRAYLASARAGIGALAGVDEPAFLRWFDLTGVQRHIKVAGIFCRLWHRDGKPGYLGDIPTTLRYLEQVGAGYPETRELVDTLRALDLENRLAAANARVFAGKGAVE